MTAATADDVEITPLELFFDLVFAFTTTQVTTLLTNGLMPALPQAVLILVVLFWMYEGYVWLINQVPMAGLEHRLFLVFATGGFLLAALATPNAFAGDGVVFGIGYLVVVLVHSTLYSKALGSDARLFVPYNIVGALALIFAGLLVESAAYVIWVAVVVLQFISAAGANRVTQRRDWHVHARHFVDRCSGLLLIAIGESVIATGIGLEGTRLDAPVVVSALTGFALAAALWWAHFDVEEGLAVTAMRRATPARQIRIAVGGYFYAYLLMLFGIVATAAGVRLSIARFAEVDTAEGAAFLAGGVALYLLGDVAYRLTVGIRPVWTRVAAAAVAATTFLIGTAVSTGVQVVALLALVIVMLVVEGTASRTHLRSERAA